VLAASLYEQKSVRRPAEFVGSVALAGFEIAIDEMLAAR